MTPDELLRHLESLLFVSSEPAEITQLAAALEVPVSEVESAIEEMAERCKWRGIRVQRKGQRVQLASSPDAAPYIEKYLGLNAVTRLSQAALETLAIIAYRQPITRPEIEGLRGVDCDGVLRTLTARQLIVELGRLDTVGHPIRYGTTFEFLRYFGLERLDQLPSLLSAEPIALAGADDRRVGEQSEAGPISIAHEETSTDDQKSEPVAQPLDTGAVDGSQRTHAQPSEEPASVISAGAGSGREGEHEAHAPPVVPAGTRESRSSSRSADDKYTDSESAPVFGAADLSTGHPTHDADASTIVTAARGQPAPASPTVQGDPAGEASHSSPDPTAITPGSPAG
jgi:segregation and condensation protein B